MIYGFNASEVFKIAIDIEENGLRFYEKAQAKTDDAEVKKIFAELAGEELKHKARFTELRNELPEAASQSQVWDPDNEMDQYLKMMADMHVFRTGADVDVQLDKVQGATEALKLAMQFEKDSIVFFAEIQNMAEGAESRDKIGVLVKEEQGHLRRLALQLRRLGK
ncbi:MAG: ferritin family protein [Proteobacteria bacterium]|nr:ferritin family protein [Pseudomonadota bacterium]